MTPIIGDEGWTPCNSVSIAGDSMYKCCKHINHFKESSAHYSPEHYYQWYRPLTEEEKIKYCIYDS